MNPHLRRIGLAVLLSAGAVLAGDDVTLKHFLYVGNWDEKKKVVFR